MTDRVRITDVSPRDGLQNEAGVIPTADKARLVGLLCGTGVDEVEVTSFVSPRWVPQLGDAAEVVRLLRGSPRAPHPILSALAPNAKGMEEFLRASPDGFLGKVSVFTAASEAFARKNTNASIAETIERFRPIISAARGAGVAVRGYVSCIIACPFEGPVAPGKVAEVAGMLRDLGVDELDLGDTIGAGAAGTVAEVLRAVRGAWPLDGRTAGGDPSVTVHLHDTFGRAAECVRAALDLGVRSFDGSVAGLGGCPYAGTPERRAPGNIDTGLLVETVEEAGHRTGVDRGRLEVAAAFARGLVDRSRAAP